MSFVTVSLILYHLYSSLLKSHPYLFLVTSVICLFLCFICLCLLSLSIISTHPFSIASLPFSCNIFPLFLFVFHLSLSPLILYHLYSSLLNRIPTFFLKHLSVDSFWCFICVCLLSFSIISTHPFSIASYLFLVTSFLVSFRVSFVSVSSHSLLSLLIPSSIASLPFSCNIFLGFFSCFICLCLLSFSIISTHPFSIPFLLSFSCCF